MVKTFGAFAVEMLHFLEIAMRLSVPINLTPVIPRSPTPVIPRSEATWESVSF